jgi:hypothetical protein
MGKYSVVAECFRSRSLYLLSLSDAEFLGKYILVFPCRPHASSASRQQLVGEILTEEFGGEISEQLLLPQSLERKNEKLRPQALPLTSPTPFSKSL